MLNTDPNDLVLYFKMLQMLGRFNEIILADVARLESLSTDVRNQYRFDWWWQKSYKHNEDTNRVLEYNWGIVRKRQQQAADKITTRIKQTKEEVRGLIDGVSFFPGSCTITISNRYSTAVQCSISYGSPEKQKTEQVPNGLYHCHCRVPSSQFCCSK